MCLWKSLKSPWIFCSKRLQTLQSVITNNLLLEKCTESTEFFTFLIVLTSLLFHWVFGNRMPPDNKKLSASCKIQSKLGLLRAPIKMSASYLRIIPVFQPRLNILIFLLIHCMLRLKIFLWIWHFHNLDQAFHFLKNFNDIELYRMFMLVMFSVNIKFPSCIAAVLV